MEALVLVLLVLLAAFAAATGIAVVLTVLAVRAATAALRPPVERAALRARTYGLGGASDVARVRWELRSAVEASDRVLASARAQRWPVGDGPALQARLAAAARSLDAELRAVEAEPEPARRSMALAAVRPRVDVVVRGAADLRSGLAAAAARCHGDELQRLAHDCRLEGRALQG